MTKSKRRKTMGQQNTTQKTKDWATRTPPKEEVKSNNSEGLAVPVLLVAPVSITFTFCWSAYTNPGEWAFMYNYVHVCQGYWFAHKISVTPARFIGMAVPSQESICVLGVSAFSTILIFYFGIVPTAWWGFFSFCFPNRFRNCSDRGYFLLYNL
jgi:hypothetical protein